MNFEVLQLFTKVFSTKLGGVASFGSDTSEQSAKSFLCENFISAKSRKFSPSKVSSHMVGSSCKRRDCVVHYLFTV